ncbi:MAG: hypothetical protein C4329_09720 [Chitinophagaceae bacterium]
MENNNHYTAEDIQRYHEGKLSPKEMHVLEHAALDDPFLADALEGYQITGTAKENITELRERLQQKTTRRKVVPLFQPKDWLRVAAIMAVILTAGWIGFTVLNEQPDKLAVGKLKSKPTEDKQVTVQPNIPSDEKLLVDSIASGNVGTYSLSEPKKKNHRNAIASKPVTISPADDNNKITLTNAAPTSKQVELNKAKDSMALRQAPVASNQYGRADSNALQEVVVTGMAMKRLKKTSTDSTVRIEGLEPKNGLNDYYAYVINYQKQHNLSPTLSGEVKIEFDVDENGDPVYIEILSSTCDECAEEAIEILKKGPKWKKLSNTKGKIIIAFNSKH